MKARDASLLVFVAAAAAAGGFFLGRLSASRDLASEHSTGSEVGTVTDAERSDRARSSRQQDRSPVADENAGTPLARFEAKLSEVESAREIWRSASEWTWRIRGDLEWEHSSWH